LKNFDYDVIIPVYNARDTIVRALNSVLFQTVLPRRVIIINDGSIDDTFNVISELINKNNFTISVEIYSIDNAGAANARNMGIRISTAPFLAFLDADDFWNSKKIENQIPYTVARGFVHSNCFSINSKGQVLRKISNKLPGSFENLLNGGYTVSGSSSSVVVSREYLIQVGFFNTNLLIGEDLDLWLRLSQLGEISEVKEFDVYIVESPSGVQLTTSKQNPIKKIEDLATILSQFKPKTELLTSPLIQKEIISIVTDLLYTPHTLFKFLIDLKSIELISDPKNLLYKTYSQILKHIVQLTLLRSNIHPKFKILSKVQKKVIYEINKLKLFKNC
jgi:glycosyltransferase involved in cell wall biosynthesis